MFAFFFGVFTGWVGTYFFLRFKEPLLAYFKSLGRKVEKELQKKTGED